MQSSRRLVSNAYPERDTRVGRAGGGTVEPRRLWVGLPYNRQPANHGNGWMAAFTAPSRAAVNEAHAAALAHGGTDEGAPGPRPHYADNYYGAYVRDPDGNKLHFVTRVG